MVREIFRFMCASRGPRRLAGSRVTGPLSRPYEGIKIRAGIKVADAGLGIGTCGTGSIELLPAVPEFPPGINFRQLLYRPLPSLRSPHETTSFDVPRG